MLACESIFDQHSLFGSLTSTNVTAAALRHNLQVSVKKGGAVVGKNIREVGFRGRFNAAVIAVKRCKVRQPGRLGDLVLQEKDVLVISTGSLFDPTEEDFAANFEK